MTQEQYTQACQRILELFNSEMTTKEFAEFLHLTTQVRLYQESKDLIIG